MFAKGSVLQSSGSPAHLSLGSLWAGWSSASQCPLWKRQLTNEWITYSCKPKKKRKKRWHCITDSCIFFLTAGSGWEFLPRKLGVVQGHDFWPGASRESDDRWIFILQRETSSCAFKKKFQFVCFKASNTTSGFNSISIQFNIIYTVPNHRSCHKVIYIVRQTLQ